ncbi:MAG: Gfo/Idh/MocA family oxidoreductase [Phycisphaerae bacterium]|nr:Gfo/Idh/MocA family oxidoreductase [Phycisphaerae bacterium]
MGVVNTSKSEESERSKKELCVGVIGCGMLAQMTHLPHLKELPSVRLKWVCDINPETLEKVKNTYQAEQATQDYHEVLNDSEVDAIVLATIQDLRKPVIEAAVRMGKAVYCEKPMAGTLKEMEEIQQIVEPSGIVFTVGHNRRSSPAMAYARQVFQKQWTSPVPCPWRFDRNSSGRSRWPEEDQAYMVIRINDDMLSWKPWALGDDIMTTGPMLFEMTHFTDLACWFLKKQPVRVTTTGHLRINQTVVIEYEDGSMVNILMTGVGTFGYPKELYEIFCNGSAVIMDGFIEVRTAGIEGVPARTDFSTLRDLTPAQDFGGGIRDFYAKRRWAQERAVALNDPMECLRLEPLLDKGHKLHLVHFLDAVRGIGENPCTCGESVLATRIAFAAIESLKSGKTVSCHF